MHCAGAAANDPGMLRPVLACLALTLTAAAPAKPDWTRTVATTAEGWQVGNPGAPRKVVEYLSLNCPHCAEVSRELGPELKAAVRAGSLSWEIRPMGLFPHDVPATLLARCVPAPRRLEFIEAYYLQVPGFTDTLRASQLTASGVGSLREASERGSAALATKVAELAGMKPLAARFGLAGPGYARCLGDPNGHRWFDRLNQAAASASVTGTPTFFVNGRRLTFRSMDELRAGLLARP